MDAEVLMAIWDKDKRAMQRLLSCGLDINSCDEDGLSILMNAILDQDGPDTGFVKFLVECGADVNMVDSGSQKWTALHFAARDQRFEIVKILLEAGAEVDAQDGWGNTPLARSLSRNSADLRIVEALLLAGADCRKENNYGNSPLGTCQLAGDHEVITLMTRVV